MYVPLRKAVEATGLHPWTLRKYADNGSISSIRTPNGQRLFDIDAFLRRTDAMVCYARVSTPKQRADLDRQAAYLSERYPGAEVIKDIGSGLNFKRKGLRSLLERAMCGERLTVVISYRDRLSRFGFDLIEWIITRPGGRVVVLHQIDTSPTAELVADLLAVLTVFSSRLHGLRDTKRRVKADFVEAGRGSTGDSALVDGGIPVGVQLHD